MSIRRSMPLLLGLSLLAAACGESDAAKSSPRDAVGQGSAEGAAAGSAVNTGIEGMGEGTTNQPGTPANDTTPHRPGPEQQP